MSSTSTCTSHVCHACGHRNQSEHALPDYKVTHVTPVGSYFALTLAGGGTSVPSEQHAVYSQLVVTQVSFDQGEDVLVLERYLPDAAGNLIYDRSFGHSSWLMPMPTTQGSTGWESVGGCPLPAGWALNAWEDLSAAQQTEVSASFSALAQHPLAYSYTKSRETPQKNRDYFERIDTAIKFLQELLDTSDSPVAV